MGPFAVRSVKLGMRLNMAWTPEETANAPEEAGPPTKRQGGTPQKAVTDAFCPGTSARAGRYADGNGLYLHGDPSGARRWVQRLVVQGRSRTLGLGGYGVVSLARGPRPRPLANRRRGPRGRGNQDARGSASTGGRTHLQGGGGQGRRHLQRGRGGRAARRRPSGRASFRSYVFPHLGDTGVDRVTSADVMAALQPIWTRKHITARKVHQRIGAVMRLGHRPGLPDRQPGRRPDHGGAAAAAGAGAAPTGAAAPRGGGGPRGGGAARAAWAGTRLAFELLVRTATRSAEVRLAKWREVDPAARVWTIPASRMKAKRGAPGAAERPGGRGAGRGGGAAATSWCSRASAATMRTGRRRLR